MLETLCFDPIKHFAGTWESSLKERSIIYEHGRYHSCSLVFLWERRVFCFLLPYGDGIRRVIWDFFSCTDCLSSYILAVGLTSVTSEALIRIGNLLHDSLLYAFVTDVTDVRCVFLFFLRERVKPIRYLSERLFTV